MYRLKHLIERIFTKKNIKIFVLVFVIAGFFVGASFAANGATDMTPTQKVSYLMNIIISILSWGWLVLATLAGKFMTNDFVYGTFLHLDSSLWNLWNMMKNFANFTLGFILIFTIVKNLFKGSFGGDDPIKNAKDTVINTLIAGVLIQMSRFLIAVLIDLSTIATAAVGSLPSQFMVGSTDFQGDMVKLIGSVENRVEIDLSTTGNITSIIKTGNYNTEDDMNKLVDTIMPSSNSMVGPFIFLGASVFNLFDLTNSSKNLSGGSDWSDLFLQLGINGFVLFIFSVTLALVFAFNLFRVITLRLVIPLSPFIFLFYAFSRGGKAPIDLGKGILKDVMNLENIVKLIFKPVFMTLVLSIVLIVMVLVRSLIKADGGELNLTEHNGMTIESRKSTDDTMYDSSLDISNIASVNLHLKNSIVDILIYLICLILMVLLVKSSVTTGTGIGFVDNQINGLSKIIWGEKGKIGGLLGKAGVLPLGTVDKDGNPMKIGIGTVIDYVKDAGIRLNGDLTKMQNKQDEAIKEALGINKNSVSGGFDSLAYPVTTIDERKEWIDKAAKILIGKGYTKERDFFNDESFSPAMSKANEGLRTARLNEISSLEIKQKIDELINEGTKSNATEPDTTEQTAS